MRDLPKTAEGEVQKGKWGGTYEIIEVMDEEACDIKFSRREDMGAGKMGED